MLAFHDSNILFSFCCLVYLFAIQWSSEETESITIKKMLNIIRRLGRNIYYSKIVNTKKDLRFPWVSYGFGFIHIEFIKHTV